MPLNRLCFILPADSDEIEPPAQTPKKHRDIGIRCRVSAAVHRTLHWFCNRRWHDMCLCFAYNPSIHHQDSSRFEDIHGIDDDRNSKKVTGSTNPRTFSYAELYIGTNGFSDDEVLGSGGFGRVYRAVLQAMARRAASSDSGRKARRPSLREDVLQLSLTGGCSDAAPATARSVVIG
ncbi:uncharacterized protein A4U43_UnF1940 [Asparagus officinalis]|uniref:Protein kinase domain-containing protein n=1 Tax=Asparagus officinalis TaxID=4686 RepID=A0A1R3L7E4_ASPOF|nr:uncharacterized protein A4U43_UnF1940 [Asparagus officinalis]